MLIDFSHIAIRFQISIDLNLVLIGFNSINLILMGSEQVFKWFHWVSKLMLMVVPVQTLIRKRLSASRLLPRFSASIDLVGRQIWRLSPY